MAQFLAEYGMFLLKALTIVAAIVVIIGVAASTGRKGSDDHLEVEDLNKRFRGLAGALRKAVLTKDERKQQAKEEKKQDKARAKQPSTKPRSFVVDFKGDLKATAVSPRR